MKYSSKIEKCCLSPIRKFYPYTVEAAKKGLQIYQLNIGQPDIITPPVYFEQLRECRHPILAYAPSPGDPSLIAAMQAYYEQLGVHYQPEDILITTGGSEALQIVLQCILDEGDEIIVPEPFYPNYLTFVNITGGRICPLTTTPETGYHYASRERIEALINPRTRAILFTNPGNPTGTVLTHDELRMLADVAKAHNLFIIGDEVYREFVYGGEALTSIGQFGDIANHAIVIDSVSKRFSACGARVGAAITRNQQLQQHMMKCGQARLSVATLDQTACAALYGLRRDYFDSIREKYRSRRDTAYRKLLAMDGVVCGEPKGAFYIMARLPVQDTNDLQTWLLTHFNDNGETVMFAPGDGFYATPGLGHDEIRLAYVLDQKSLERALDLLSLGIQKYRKCHAQGTQRQRPKENGATYAP